ncbi:Disease resistance protein (CC-NBS-LRR class) family [Rhynchospora pubera]|uniref:Disease resistance protein (CC-NBS-LRR class) family n=1 Tax=Rhynchospora pubera TaxID=906938 RepID=A0AAV8EPC2_9POAL|nr:Disease resistance protein (CC-NBS-LRR class) family [Rhynchospora pubera]
MAETAVNFVLGKLGEMIVKEAQSLGEVGDKVKWMETELTRIKCYLIDADSKRRKGDARAENWLNELRDVAYRIEDATDTFYVEIEDNRHKVESSSQKDHSFLGKLKRLGHKTTKLPALHRLGAELDAIRKVLEGISKSKVDYDIDPLQERDEGETILMPLRRAAYEDVDDETEVVGFNTHKNKVYQLIIDPDTQRRAVVTIVGSGGIGKTTLAHMVYKSVQANFDFHMMLSVSQQFSPADLLRKMLTKLRGSEPTTRDIGELFSELKGLLNSMRYLIILDDVWVTDLWNQLKHVLPDVKNGSRVLMTSRFIEVAQSADPVMKPYELEFLNEENSRNLLLKKALPYQNSGEKCPDDLLELADELSKKCKGLPLALIILGGILSKKDPTYTEWRKVLRTLDWHYDGKDCIDILAMSYEDLPYYLKSFFLYLALFPEDYEISARRLIMMWVAEGLMLQQERKTKEEIAEDYLEQLVQRSMVQVSSRHVDGSIKNCRLHDLLRDFAMHQAAKENFVTVFANPQDIKHCDRTTRRALLQLCDPGLMEYLGPKTRSLFLFDLSYNLFDFSKFRLLRVLEITNTGLYLMCGLGGFDRLIHLKYLAIRNCEDIDMRGCSFGHLKNLETLEIQDCPKNMRVGLGKSYLPTDLWTITTLRHVRFVLMSLPEVPSTADFPNLQTLEWMPFNEKQIPHLTNLRRLGLRNESTEWDVEHAVPRLLGGLSSLTSLKIGGKNLPMEIVYPRALPHYQNLQILFLIGNLSDSVILKASLFPPHLIKLTLWDSNLGQDPMPELGKINNLKKLALIGKVYKGKQMVCPEGFPILHSLVLRINNEVLTVTKGVMPKLKDVRNTGDIKLEMPPELMHLI